jgi:MFS family permease
VIDRQPLAVLRPPFASASLVDPAPFSELDIADQRPAAMKAASPAPVRPWQIWLLMLLTMSVVLSFADRGLTAILLDPIKADLGLSDVQMSLMMGFSFSVIYSLAALPLGALVDRLNRKRMIAIAIISWSLMTMLCGLAQGFGQFVTGRMGLGVAEAVLGPAAFSLIRNSFPAMQRGRAFAVFNSSHLIGTGSALLVGGSLFGLASRGGLARVPVVDGLHPWQQVMVLLGLIGLPFGLLVLTMREPRRAEPAGAASFVAGFAEALRHAARNKAVLLPFWAGVALFALAQGGATWTAMVIHRSWDVPIPAIGRVLGPLQIVVGLIGSLTLGVIMDTFAQRGRRDAPFFVCMVSLTLSAIAMAAQFAIPSLRAASIVYVFQIFFFAAHAVAASAGLALIAPPALAGKLQAITGLASNLIGLALGPTAVALVSTHVFSGPYALHDALVLVVVVAIALGVGMYALVMRALRRQAVAPAIG